MPISGLPVFADDQVLTAAQLNSLTNALNTKFSHNVGGADLTSPLTLPGNLDMNFNDILNLYRFWNVYSLADRPTGNSVQSVFTAVDNAGGGTVYIKPGTTHTLSNITIGSNTLVLGGGNASVLSPGASPSTNGMFRNPTGNEANLAFVGLLFDGSANVAANCDCIVLRQAKRVRILDCEFRDIKGRGVYATNNGVAANTTDDVVISRCIFRNTSAAIASLEHIAARDCIGMEIVDCTFDRVCNSANMILVKPDTDGTSLVQKVKIVNCNVRSVGGDTPGVAILVTTASAVPASNTATCKDLTVIGIVMDGTSSNSNCVIDVQRWTKFKISNNEIRDCSTSTDTVPAIRVQNSRQFEIVNNEITDGSSHGIVIGCDGHIAGTAGTCSGFIIQHNNIRTMGLAGIIIAGSTQFTMSNNAVHGCLATRDAFELWSYSTTTNFISSTISGNAGTNDTVTPARGMRTYSDSGTTARAAIGSGGANTRLAVIGNALPGLLIGAGAGNDFDPANCACLATTNSI